jgi:hypothetical protein
MSPQPCHAQLTSVDYYNRSQEQAAEADLGDRFLTCPVASAGTQQHHQAAQALMEETLLRRTRTVSLLEWWRFAYFR